VKDLGEGVEIPFFEASFTSNTEDGERSSVKIARAISVGEKVESEIDVKSEAERYGHHQREEDSC